MSDWQTCPRCGVLYQPPFGAAALCCPDCAAPLAAAFGPLASEFDSRHDVLSEAQVVPEAANCVQCGMCSYNCPMGIDVRAHAWRGKAIRDSHCLTCSECVRRCPRGVLRFERIALFGN
jgi:ferredoxin